MIKLVNALSTWMTPEFESHFKAEIEKLRTDQLPLQQGLSKSSYVSDSDINVVILNSNETANTIQIKTGIFYAGIITGSCCADDPTPVDEQTEYCEIEFEINKQTAETTVSLLID